MNNITQEQAQKVLNYMTLKFYCDDYGNVSDMSRYDGINDLQLNKDGSVSVTLESGQTVTYTVAITHASNPNN